MELTALRYFVTLAHELHFHRAAERLHITQSPLSLAIRKLEDELETRLFERTSRQVKLTAEGSFFLPEAEAVLQRAALAEKRLTEMKNSKGITFAIGYNEPSLNSFLPGLLARCRNRHRQLKLELRELETTEQLRYLREGVLDIGFMRPAGFELAGLEHRSIFQEKYHLAMTADHPLAQQEKVTAADLSGREIILFLREINPFIFDQITAALTIPGTPPPNFRQDARNKSSMLAMVKAGFGAALLPGSCCPANDPLITVKTLSAPLPPVDIMAVWRQDNDSTALQNFIALLENFSGPAS